MARYGGDYGYYGGGYEQGRYGGSYYGGYGPGAYDRGYGYRSDELPGRRVYTTGGAYRRGYGYDRDLGDRLREGWNDLKRGVRRAFGGGYDRGYYGGRGGYGRYGYDRYGDRGGYPVYGRGYDRGWF